MWIEIDNNLKDAYNEVVMHPLQSFEWGEFRQKTGVRVIRRGFYKNKKLSQAFTLTIHSVPKTKFTVGYLPKSSMPTKEMLEELKRIGREQNCIFIQLEPNVLINDKSSKLNDKYLTPSFHPLFTKFTFILDISRPADELLKSFHPKTRYNIKIALKRKVAIREENTDKAFEEYLHLTRETTMRQKFYAHTPEYHKKMWQTLGDNLSKDRAHNPNKLTAHLLKATYEPDKGPSVTLATWILFVFHDTLYYPYGASSSLYRNVMASNLIMWEAILFGKRLGLKSFDMWGALGPNPNPKDPWHGFHRFKEGYGATHTEFIGSYDLIIRPNLYKAYKIADKGRWLYLRLKKVIKPS